MRTIYEYFKDSIEPADDMVLVVVKPEFTKVANDVLNRFMQDGYKCVATASRRISYDDAKRLYAVHKKEDFFQDLCKYMASDVSTAFLLQYTGDDDIYKRTDEIKKELRDKYGVSEMRNCLHSSDSREHFLDEKKVYFY